MDRVLRDLELSPTQLADAQQSYQAVTQVLAKAGTPVAPHLPFMFAQGSMRLGTTVKPIGQDEHDLDIVCLLKKGGIGCLPMRFTNSSGKPSVATAPTRR